MIGKSTAQRAVGLVVLMALTSGPVFAGQDAGYWYERGVQYGRQQRFDDALQAFQRSVHLDPGMAPAWAYLGRVQQQLGRHVQALLSFEQALRIRPDMAAARQGRDASLETFARITPRSAGEWFGHGLWLRTAGRHGDALEALDHALGMDPLLADAWTYRGRVLHAIALQSLGRPVDGRRPYEILQEALTAFDRTIALRPDDAGAWAGKGAVLETLKREDGALAAYERAVDILPAYPEARNARDRLRLAIERMSRDEQDFLEQQHRNGAGSPPVPPANGPEAAPKEPDPAPVERDAPDEQDVVHPDAPQEAAPRTLLEGRPATALADAIAIAEAWRAPDGWSEDRTELDLRPEGVLRVRIHAGPDGKNVIGRNVRGDLSAYRWLAMDITSELAATARLALGLSTGEQWFYFESHAEPIRPGDNHVIVFDLQAGDFKSEDTGWAHAASVDDLDDVKAIHFLFYPRGEGVLLIRNIRLVEEG